MTFIGYHTQNKSQNDDVARFDDHSCLVLHSASQNELWISTWKFSFIQRWRRGWVDRKLMAVYFSFALEMAQDFLFEGMRNWWSLRDKETEPRNSISTNFRWFFHKTFQSMHSMLNTNSEVPHRLNYFEFNPLTSAVCHAETPSTESITGWNFNI